MRCFTSTLAALLFGAVGIFALLGGGKASAQTFTVDVVADTILLHNGGTSQAEQNYGGRNELIGAKNGGAPRDILLRFDVSAAATEIMNAGLAVVDARLILNPRDERLALHQGYTIFPELGVFGLVSQNQGWVEGTAIGAGAGLQGQLGSVSRLYLATPSSATPGGGPADDGVQWFSAGGGPTSETIPTQFNIAGDTTNFLLGSASTASVDRSGGDADWEIPLDGELFNPFMSDWLAAPQTNAGLVISQISPGNSNQWFFESLEGGRPEEAARLSITFGTAPIPGDVNNSGFTNSADFDVIRQNFWQEFTERNEGDLVNNDFIDFADFGAWKQAPKAPDAAALGIATIPEPSSILLCLAGVLLGFVWRRRTMNLDFSISWQRVATVGTSTMLIICSFSNAAFAQTPVAHWTFDQGLNNYDLTDAIDSVNANNGTWQGADTTGLSYVAGQIGGAARLRGANNDFFLVPSVPQINGIAPTPLFPDNPVLGVGVTWSAWINVDVDSAQGYKGILVTRTAQDDSTAGVSGANRNWGFAWEVNGSPFNSHIDSRVGGAAVDSSASPNADSIMRGQWHHVALVWGNVSESLTPAQRLYVDGMLTNENPDTGVFEIISSGSWLIGEDSCCGGREFDGLLDDLAIFDFALTPAQIQTIYNNGLNGIDASGSNTGQILPGDVDGGGVSISDFNIIRDNLGESVSARNLGDLDGNRRVDLNDFQQWLEAAPSALAAEALASFSTPIPEPSGVVLLGLTVVAGSLVRRRIVKRV